MDAARERLAVLAGQIVDDGNCHDLLLPVNIVFLSRHLYVGMALDPT